MNRLEYVYASPEDAKDLLSLVKDLAIYERAENEVYTSESDFKEGIESGLFKALLAKLDGITVGMALFYPVFSTWNGQTMFLEDFIVKNELRGQGIGAQLFDRWIEESKRAGAKMLKWQVLDWNEPAKNFYRKYQAKFYPGWENGVIYLYDRL
ncbi:MAG: GNAT family N-acetyltransferase [Saprospiraceae bacterium]|nr:GNAT family N-acetyltransferase [Saprospiraceae bacterium]